MYLLNPFALGSSNGGFLDNLATTPRAVWSLRKMISTATVAIRIRRSSDNAEMDIGFSGSTVGSGLDNAAITSFVGSNSAFIVKWYDQTGNGQDALQSTASKQPRIVNAGSIQSAVKWDGTDDYLIVTTLTNTNPQCAFYSKIKLSAGSDKLAIETSTNYNNNAGALIFYASATGGYDLGMCQSAGATRDSRFAPSTLGSALNQVSLFWDRTGTGSSEVAMYVAGSSQSPSVVSSTECTGNMTTQDCYLGCRAGSSFFTDWEVETLVFYNADTLSLRTSIEAIVA